MSVIVTTGASAPGPQGPAGPPGSAGPWVDVAGLSGSPAGVADWGPLILTARDNGARGFLFRDYVGGGAGDFPFSTFLNFDNSCGIVLAGVNGKIWPGDQAASFLAPSRLRWTGAGSGNAISGKKATGLCIANLGVYYDNASYSGTLVQLGAAGGGGVSQTALIVESVLRSTPASGLSTARAIVSLDDAIVSTIRDSVVGYAQYAISGLESNFSNENRILNNTIQRPAVAAIGNLGVGYTIDNNTFEMGGNVAGAGPAVLKAITAGHGGGQFTFTNNGLYDYDASSIPFQLDSTSSWYATFAGNKGQTFDTGVAATQPVLWKLAGGGVIYIVGNPGLVNNGNGVGARMVDLVGPSPQKELWWAGNATSATGVAEAIVNRAGHRLHIEGSDQASILGVHEISGHERVAYPARQPGPSIVKGAGLGSGSSAAAITGHDTAGQIAFTAGTSPGAGVIGTVTLGTAPTFPPGGLAELSVQITPYASPGAVDAGMYVSAVTSTGFEISARNVPAGNFYCFYRVTLV